jgi:MFS transporter, NRE family, putaive nickel resistance protein
MSETPSETTSPRHLWRNHDCKLLFGGQIISLLGSGVTTIGLALFAYQLTGGPLATAVIGNALTLRIFAFLSSRNWRA